MAPRLLFSLLLLCHIAGCTNMKPEDYAAHEPRLRLEDYFAGETKAWGLFQDRFGQVRRRFTVDIVGTWDGSTLTLVEDFLYDDGETEQRVWRIEKTGENSYRGEADDVLGEAHGKAFGNAMNWRYALALKVGSGSWTVQFNDWLFLLDQEVIVNRASVTKLGIEIGEVTLFFRKSASEEIAPSARRAERPGHAGWIASRGGAAAHPSYQRAE